VSASEFKFKLSRKTAPVGTVVFKLVNRGKIAHDFKINGKKTPLVKPGKSVTLKVVFKKKGRYAYLCTVPGHAALGMKGVLGVGTTAPPPPPAAKPTTTAKTTTTAQTTTTAASPGPGGTVQVSMFEYGFKLSPSIIPSGSVTFVMNNTGTVTHNFDVEGVKAGSFVDPGKSATMTVNVQAGRAYNYECDVPGHAALGMRGTFTPSS
jgi:nitrite reductase (NO-forming)